MKIYGYISIYVRICKFIGKFVQMNKEVVVILTAQAGDKYSPEVIRVLEKLFAEKEESQIPGWTVSTLTDFATSAKDQFTEMLNSAPPVAKASIDNKGVLEKAGGQFGSNSIGKILEFASVGESVEWYLPTKDLCEDAKKKLIKTQDPLAKKVHVILCKELKNE